MFYTLLLMQALSATANLPPPLAHALAAARAHNHTLGISRAQLSEQEAAVYQALAALTPTGQISGSYVRSQYPTIVPFLDGFTVGSSASGTPNVQPTFNTITIQPTDSLNANLGVNVPLVIPTGIAHFVGTRRARNGAAFAEKASDGDVLLSTARTYYQVVAAQGVLEAAVHAVDTARDNLKVAETRHNAGTETLLTVDRAKVDLNRALQTAAVGRQTLGVAQRSLETLTGERLAQALPPPPPPELPKQSEADYVDKALNARPEVRQAREVLAQQEAAVYESWGQLMPSLIGNVTEHVSNAKGFLGKYGYWTAGVSLNWVLDPVGTPASVQHGHAVVEEQRQRMLQTEDSVRDDVHTVWLEIEADRARLEEATAEQQSAKEALDQATLQFQAGTATSLDVSSAQRDAFNADATLAQTKSDLAGALIALEKAAGVPLLADASDQAASPNATGSPHE